MTSNSESSPSIQNIIAIVIIVAVICLTAIVIKPGIFPGISKPTPTAIQPTSSAASQYQPEIFPILTHTPAPTQTATSVPTDTPLPTLTPFILPTIEFDNLPLPDLIVSGLSDPVCATEYEGTKLRFTIFIRNIGSASTRNFGSFDTAVYLIIGDRHYSLDEWTTEFNGVIGSSVVKVASLSPDQDIKFTVVIDLIGNKDFGIEVTANSGDNPIREADTTNNTLIKYFSVYCY